MAGVFSDVQMQFPGRSVFNLSHSNLFDCSYGQLIPAFCMEAVPGDKFEMSADVVGRLSSALQSPMLAEMDVMLEAFFVPTRLLMGRDSNFKYVTPGEGTFEDFLTGGRDGNLVVSLPVLKGSDSGSSVTFARGGVGDYLGVQTGCEIATEDAPLAFPWRAYRYIWNWFYRDENLMDEVQESQGSGENFIPFDDYDSLLSRCWRKDYFTSALPWQQRGTTPALPLTGSVPVSWYSSAYDFDGAVFPVVTFARGTDLTSMVPATTSIIDEKNARSNFNFFDTSAEGLPIYAMLSPTDDSKFGAGSVDLSNVATFDVSDLRTAFQIQKILERSARSGYRYTEYLRATFGTSPSDARLQMPEFIGQCRSPWIQQEVLQTSSSENSTPQGTQAGQAINLSSGNIGTYHCKEFGYILVLCSVVPKAQYQQGIPRYLSRRSRYDFYNPALAHLSEQAVLNKEIFVSGSRSVDNGVFGYQGIWNELRFIPSRVSNHMRSDVSDGGYTFDYWHLARYFANTPALNAEFLQINGEPSVDNGLMRVFAVQDENPFILHVGLNVRAVRPLPFYAEPGLVDHF